MFREMNEEDFKKLKGKSADAFDNVPADYFKNLPNQVMNSINEKEKSKNIILLRPAFLVAAASIIILLGFAILLNNTQQNNSDNRLAKNNTQSNNHELMVQNDTSIRIPAKDSMKLDKTSHTGLEEDNDNLFATLDDIPAEVIIDYLMESDEFIF